MSNASKASSKSTGNRVSKPKSAAVNLGPGKPNPVALVKDSAVGDYLRLSFGHSGGTYVREMIIHHPIGLTGLTAEEWVLSEVSDIPLLVQRRSDPNAATLQSRRAAWLEGKAVDQGLLRREADGSCVYDVEGRSSTRTVLKAELKKSFAIANPSAKPKDFDFEKSLRESRDPRAAKEAEILRLFRALGGEADLKFKSTFQTKGGARAERPQVAVSWAKGLPATAVADMIVNHGLDGPPSRSNTKDEETDPGGSVPPSISVTTGDRLGRQWFFAPSSLDKEARSELRSALAEAKRKLETSTKKKYIFRVEGADCTDE